ncbi:prolyl oligopeptidase family serine peptidase [Gemmata sp. JC717]|uniref:prolyl oligopeptidase family serine peptidase n=1 Tax=Gemmata algarum TaxID=2975278 RepID=UPI0021BB1D11|nr:prolyl oligopeptidase family serine peptidase [Gemmata algarum]MDY3552814.1 prolyl oligopeptidase family serine peptidase [Gemmata algarum]
MLPRCAVSSRAIAALVLVAGFVVTLRAEDPQKTREQEIAEVQKQLEALQKKLDELNKKKSSLTTPAAKKVLTFADADKWRSIRDFTLSPDGKWFAHRVGATEGEGDLFLRNIADGKETKFPGGTGFGTAVFSLDSKWFAFTYAPPTKGGTAPGSGGKAKVTLVNLATGDKTEIEGAASARFNGEAATHLVFRKVSEPAAGAPAGTAPAASGSDLVLRDLATGTDLVLGNVAEFDFTKKGDWLVTVIDASGRIGNGVHLREMKTGLVYPIEASKANYRSLSWNEDTTAFVVTKQTEDAGSDAKPLSIVGFTELGPKPTKAVYDPKDDKGFPTDFVITGPAAWTDGLDGFRFSITERKKKTETAPAPKEVKSETKTDPKDDGKKGKKIVPTAGNSTDGGKPDLVVWHWKDERLQPMQEKQASSDRVTNYSAVYWIKDKKFVRLADEKFKQVALAPKHKFAIGRDSKPYEYQSYLTGKLYTDVYVVDPKTGARTKAVEKLSSLFFGPATVSPSPTGTHALYYKDGHYHVLDFATAKSVNVTEKVGASFVDADDDHNFDKPSTPAYGWSRDGKFVLLSDGWDIWRVSADGTGGTNLTVNGKTDAIRYRMTLQFEPEPKPGTDLTQPVYTLMYGEWSKKEGLARLDPSKTGVSVLAWSDHGYNPPSKARKADTFVFMRQSTTESADLYITDGTFKDPKKVTDSNPQQKDYKWSAGAKLIEYKGVGGKRLQGALFLPADYEPGKKYPTIVYIYEKLSQNIHRYQAPGTWGVGSVHASNGYAVLMPDITYKLNDPGVSAVECILPALDAAVATGIVDNDKVALHGHSWGGYQTAFLVTQTNRFKCAIAGAALTDLVSMYSSVYWNAGMANQPIFESSQGRFTGGYWEQQDAYIRNSPVYHATKVTTPLLLLHNDKDGAVDFTQGVEYYNTLRRLQKPVVMLQYKGENHGLAKPENRKDYAVRMKEFFDHHLKGSQAPDWWIEGVPHLKMEDHLKSRPKP